MFAAQNLASVEQQAISVGLIRFNRLHVAAQAPTREQLGTMKAGPPPARAIE